MTRKVKFIHTADLHLGAPMRGLSALSDEWAARLQTAIPEAYDRVIEAALSHQVDFVIMAGDMFDASYPSYCDYLHFFRGLFKLQAAGIPTYLVTGNHDPYTAWSRDVAGLPKSAHMLGVGVPTFELFRRQGEPLCLIGGRSYYSQAWPLDEGIADGITRTNAIGALSQENPDAADAPFAIGIIHTGLNIDASKAATEEDYLLAQDIDYWACGHLHRHMVRPIADDPRVVFPGCVQGRDIKETGERGCYLVELEEGVSPRIEFIPTASVSFHSIYVDVSGCRTLSDVENTVKTAMFRESGHDYCSEMVAHVNLVGQTELHEFLRQPNVIASARKHVNEALTGFFCDALVDYTKPARDRQDLMRENELAATVMRNSEKLRNDELIDYVQATLVQGGIAIPAALARRMDDFRDAAETLALDLVDDRGDNLDLPAAREQVASLIAEHLDRKGHADKSIYKLGDRLESRFAEVRKASEAAAVLRQEHRELSDLKQDEASMADRAAELADEVDDLTAWCGSVEKLDADMAARQDELAQLRRELDELQLVADEPSSVDQRLLDITVQDDRALRDKLENLNAEGQKLSRVVDDAKERSATSTAAYEALQEIDAADLSGSRRLASRTAQVVVSVLLPLCFAAAGIFVFAQGRRMVSLSFTVLGIALLVMAFFLAAGAIGLLLRPKKDEQALEARRQDAKWVMLQDKKLLAASQEEKEQWEASLRELLDRSGLDAADGSVRQALLMLDDASEERARLAEVNQHVMAARMHEERASAALAGLESQRRNIEEAAGLEEGASLRVLESKLRAKTTERDDLSEELTAAGERRALLKKHLEHAREDRRFDQLKLAYHQSRAQLRIAKHDYVVLLLAQRLLGE